jgi:hypothetical protein
MPPAMNAMARRAAAKNTRGKKGKKKPARSGDPRRATETGRGPGTQGPAGPGGGGPQTAPSGLGSPGGLGGLPEGFPESLADGLANLPSGLNFPPPSPGNIPAAFRGGTNKRRDKKK